MNCYEIIVIDKDICKKSAKVSRMDIRLLIKIRLTFNCENYKKRSVFSYTTYMNHCAQIYRIDFCQSLHDFYHTQI